MVYRAPAPVIKPHKNQLLHMFHLRGLFGSSKDLCFAVVLFSSIFILATCTRCTTVKEVQNRVEFRGSSYSPDVIQNVCNPSNSFCFPSTLSRFEDDKSGPELEALGASEVYSEGFSSELSQLPYHGNFRFLGGGRNISCSFYQEDGFPEFSSSSLSPLFEKKTHNSSLLVAPTESLELSFTDGLSPPPVEINPSLLDYGNKNMYHPSLAYLTVKNLDSDSFLSVYEPYSDNSQFYPCGFSATLLAPGENASLCFIFFPTHLGFSSAKLIIQMSFGGFLIQARGFSIESPYLINPLSGLEITTSGRWRKNLSLFNPFDEALQVEEVTAWVSTFSGNSTSRSSKSTCRSHGAEYCSDYNTLSAKDWLTFDKLEISLRPRENLVVSPKKMEAVLELDIPGHFGGKLVGGFCMRLLRSKNDEVDTVMIPLDAELSFPEASLDKGLVSLSLEALVPCNDSTSGSIGVALSVRNDGLCALRVIKVAHVGGSTEAFKVKPVEDLVVFSSTITQVAFISYNAHLKSHEVKMDCKIIVQVNDTRFPEMEIPCMDVISVFSGGQLDSSVGYGARINVDYINGGDRFFSMKPPSGIKALNAPESDELILQNWKSQAKVSMMSPLDMDELLFPIILIGNYSSQWISVKNPSPKSVAMQLILNSGQAINNCRTPETLLQPSSSNTLLGNSNSIAPTSYGFSLPKDAITEALIHPYSSATLGPILFQPSNRCDWRSSVLIRNNLSGVEWLPLRASGGSLSLVLHQGYEYDPVQILEFKMNLPTRLNFSSSENLLHSTGVQRASYCSESLTKIVYAKNTGDLPLEVTRVKVSGAECGLDGFIINNCTGFTILPGESFRLCISYKTDFNAATVHRDLELVSTAGIVVVPMKASIPVHRLNFCRRSVFWTRLKKATAVLLFAASLVYFIISFLFSHVTTASASLDFISGEKNSYSSGLIGTVGSKIVQDEALLLDQFAVSTSPSSVLKVDMQDTFESRDVKVIDGKGKGRRRRKKRSSGVGVLLFEASSSQSGNSTPLSPLSPSRCTTTPKVVETRNSFSRASLEQSDTSKCTKALFSEVPLKREKGNRAHSDNRVQHSSRDKPCLARKATGHPVFAPSMSFPSANGSHPPFTCLSSSSLGPTSAIAPHLRAPGTKLGSKECGGGKEKMGVEKNSNTYDIWGDRLFRIPLACESKRISSWPSSPADDDSVSLFVRGRQSLVKNCMLQSVISDIGGNE